MLNTDLHSHILPGIDDGSENAKMSADMLNMLFAQGVERIAATPHFRSHRESVGSFCHRRENAYRELCASQSYSTIEKITLGAEVALEYGVSRLEDISWLAYGFTDYILLEFPYRPFSERMLEEINSIHYDHKLTPVIAHIDRYADIFSPNDYKKIMYLDDVIFQVNNEAFSERKPRRIVDELISYDLPFVLGSDCHNTSNRAPNFDLSRKHLKKYTPHRKAITLCRSRSAIIHTIC